MCVTGYSILMVSVCLKLVCWCMGLLNLCSEGDIMISAVQDSNIVVI